MIQVGTFAICCLAQLGTDTTPTPQVPLTAGSVSGVTSVWDFVVKGGIVMVPIALCSLVALTLAVERLVSLRRVKVIPENFIQGLTDVLSQTTGAQARAAEYCRARPSPIARICEAGVRRWDRPLDQVEKLIGEAGQREIVGLRKNLRGLSVIGSVAPLLGLLGTIFGMITAFQTVAQSAEALGRTELLAGGIYEAMITTAAGLIVAIPSLLLYHYISSKIDRLVVEMDTACMSVVEQHAENLNPAGPIEAPRMNSPVTSSSAPSQVVNGELLVASV